MATDYDTITCTDRYMDTTASADMRHEYTRTLAVPVTYPMGIRDAIERERVYVGRSLLPRAIRDSMAASGGVRLIIARP